MKKISQPTVKNTLSANDMKQLKGGGACGYMLPGSTIATCGATENVAEQMGHFMNAEWCCNDCSTRTNGLAICR